MQAPFGTVAPTYANKFLDHVPNGQNHFSDAHTFIDRAGKPALHMQVRMHTAGQAWFGHQDKLLEPVLHGQNHFVLVATHPFSVLFSGWAAMLA